MRPKGGRRSAFRSARVVLEDRIDAADIEVVNGVIAAVGPVGSTSDASDVGDLTIAPGFVDIQINGGFGVDISADPATMWALGGRLPSTGTTSFLPTLVTGPDSATDAALEAFSDRPEGFVGAEPLGLHLEGPALSPARKGAHNPELLRTEPYLAAVLDHRTAIATVAPEVVNPLVIEEVVSSGTVVSVGHTDATFEESQAAFAAGARHMTHLFNAMRPLTHREPGPIAAALLDDRVTVSVIPDGVHVHPGALRLVAAIVGIKRLVAITDAVAAMGMPPGSYGIGSMLGVSDGETMRLEDGTLAGSILTMDRAVRVLANDVGIGHRAAILAATANPASVLSDDSRGVIAVGARADLCFLTDRLFVEATMVAGELVFGELP